MNPSLSRRRILASTAVGIVGLAGCADDPDVSGVVEDSSQSDNNTVDNNSEDQEAEIQGASTDQESEDSADPEDTGLIVTQTTINNISIEDAWVILRATVTVRNEDQFAYELVEIRADAYRTTPNAEGRTALEFDYETKEFDSSSPFASGTEQFQVEIAILQDEAPRQLNSDWFDVTAVVRRADKA